MHLNMRQIRGKCQCDTSEADPCSVRTLLVLAMTNISGTSIVPKVNAWRRKRNLHDPDRLS